MFLIFRVRSTSSPADTWEYFVTTTGVDPDVDIDSATELAMGFSLIPSSSKRLRVSLGPYAYGTDVRAVVRAQRDSDSTSSTNTAAVQVNATTVAPVGPFVRFGFFGTALSFPNEQNIDTTEYLNSPTNTIYFRHTPGETSLYHGSTLVWRAKMDGDSARLYMPTAWTLVNTSISGAGAATPVEVDGTDLYLCVNSVRRAKLDTSAKTFTALKFIAPINVTQNPTPSASWENASANLAGFNVFDPVRRVWRSYLTVDASENISTQDFISQTTS